MPLTLIVAAIVIVVIALVGAIGYWIDEAEEPLRASIDWARHQQAKSWELRSSTTLAQLLRERGDRNGARDLLGPIYGWFTEGFDTHDLRVARDLLDSLN